MTQKALIECLSTIDSHFGKQPSPEARRAEIQVYISVLGNIPDEIALKALPAAFAVCRYQHQFIVDWSNAIKELQAAALPSASESWAQTRRIAKRMQDNLYHARYGGIMTHEGKITPYQLRHSFATLYLQNGGDLFTLQKQMGHSDLRMTKRYTEIDDRFLQLQHTAFSPVNLLGQKQKVIKVN